MCRKSAIEEERNKKQTRTKTSTLSTFTDNTAYNDQPGMHKASILRQSKTYIQSQIKYYATPTKDLHNTGNKAKFKGKKLPI